MKALSLYIHVPFCQHKCHYCDFYSIEDPKKMDDYVKAVKRSIIYHSRTLKTTHKIETIYFGGGTPNLLSTQHLSSVLKAVKDNFMMREDPEITIEINPEFSNKEGSLQDLKNIGFNRLSIGIQSLNDDELQFLGRLHSAETAITCLRNARNIFNNLSVDIIYAIPGQSAQSLQETLNGILQFDPEHISAYNLTSEEGTPYARMIDNAEVSKPDEDVEIDFFYNIHDQLTLHAYEHYEVSNYAKTGKKSQHNSSYWKDQDYLGIGPSAHSRIGGERFAYRADLQTFLDDPEHFYEKDSVTEADTLITRLRCSEGLNRDAVSPETWQNLIKYDQKHPEWFTCSENTISCTLKGWLFLDTILLDLI
ncbi:MAG: radical SAM family heme chaperone HemW [Candidatus Marinimicrobia bacterium]|nr:radical SAM family heme chaperone HemW [Candidatus Neomarinimicrobiota bacterium]